MWTSSTAGGHLQEDRLRGWKEIAQFLHASERTVQRWEQALGLPIQRVETAKSAIVFASREALVKWQESDAGRAAIRNETIAGEEPRRTGPLGDSDIVSEPLTSGLNDSSRAAARFDHRRRQPLLGCALIVAVVFVAIGAYRASRENSTGDANGSRQGPTTNAQSRLHAGDVAVLDLRMVDGSSATVALKIGSVVTCGFGKHPSITMSGEPGTDSLMLHVFSSVGGPGATTGVAESGALRLRLKEAKAVQIGGGIAEIQWAKTIPAPITVK